MSATEELKSFRVILKDGRDFIRAHHFKKTNLEIQFFSAQQRPNPDIYLSVESVVLVAAEGDLVATGSPKS